MEMNRTHLGWRIGMLMVVAAAIASAPMAHAGKPDSPAAIRVAALSKNDVIMPKPDAIIIDPDGIQGTTAEAVVSPFTLKAAVGGDRLKVSVPEFPVEQVQWEAEPIGCTDDDPKTKCQPTWGAEYSGQAEWVPVSVELHTGGVVVPYGTVHLLLTLTVVDGKVRMIDGYLQITFSESSNLTNYRIPVTGKLK